MMEIAICFLFLESSHVSSDAELDWCNSRGRQDGESARDSATAGVCRRNDGLVMMR